LRASSLGKKLQGLYLGGMYGGMSDALVSEIVEIKQFTPTVR